MLAELAPRAKGGALAPLSGVLSLVSARPSAIATSMAPEIAAPEAVAATLLPMIWTARAFWLSAFAAEAGVQDQVTMAVLKPSRITSEVV